MIEYNICSIIHSVIDIIANDRGLWQTISGSDSLSDHLYKINALNNSGLKLNAFLALRLSGKLCWTAK